MEFEVSGVVKAVKTGKWTIGAFVTDPDAPPNITLDSDYPYVGGATLTVTISENSVASGRNLAAIVVLGSIFALPCFS